MVLAGRLDATLTNDGVEFSFTVTNAGDDPVLLAFDSGFLAEFVVSDGEREVWRWSDGRLFTQVRSSETLEPGGSLTRDATWPDPTPGAYEAVATLQSATADAEARTDVVV